MRRFPHQFSGGQRSRIGIARALAVRPALLVCDEAVASLDVSIQAQVINLFMALREDLKLTYLFISHDLGVVDLVCDEVIVLYQGRIVEHGDPDTLFRAAAHPYTRALLEAVPRLEPGIELAPAPLPEPIDAPGGCPFAPRCAFRQDRCMREAPALRALTREHRVACHEAETILARPAGA
jgi:peptide/nickel transport system ATP-binding protein